MEINYGTEVIDKDGRALGTVNYVIRNTWTGEIGKFLVRRREPANSGFRDFFVSIQNVRQVTSGKIELNVSLEELSKNI